MRHGRFGSVGTILWVAGITLNLCSGPALAQLTGQSSIPNDGKLRIIAFGAHPDDCELQL